MIRHSAIVLAELDALRARLARAWVDNLDTGQVHSLEFAIQRLSATYRDAMRSEALHMPSELRRMGGSR